MADRDTHEYFEETEEVAEKPTPVEKETSIDSDGLLFGWETKTNIPDGGRQFKPEEETGSSTDEDGKKEEASTPAAPAINLDEKTIDVLADAATNANDELMSSVLKWLYGTSDKEQYRAKPGPKASIKEAWKLIIQKLNWQPSSWDAILFSNFAAFGWSLIGGMFTAISRFTKGTLSWPWKKNKPEEEVETVKPQMEAVRDKEPAPPAEETADFSMKLCKETGKPFRVGYGYPKNSGKYPELIDAFCDSSAYRAYQNSKGNSGKKKK